MTMNYKELLDIKSLDGYDETTQINIIGKLFDFSLDNSNLNGVEQAFNLAKQVDYESMQVENKIHYHYLLANGYSYTIKLKYKERKENWNFQLEEHAKEVFHFRKAISFTEFEKAKKGLQCQIYTNLGNTFSKIGRFIEAQECWNKAIEIHPRFAMAIANKANGLYFYSNYLIDEMHRNIFILFSFHFVKEALKLKHNFEGGAKGFFERFHAFLSSVINEDMHDYIPNLNKFSLGRNKKLREYREWCLRNCLYINPLNDLGPYKATSHDCVNLPDMIFERDAPPIYFTLFNQIKQEFGTARFMYYESTRRYKPHISDIDIVIIETGELAKHSYYLEQLKASYRITYSILDKIAFLLNDYLKLGISLHDVNFRALWFEKGKKGKLRLFFQDSENWALRGLFWLSKDLFEKDEDFDLVIEPEAKELAAIRNFIEHRSFKVISEFFPYPSHLDEKKDIAYVISRDQLEAKALKLLKLTRAAIIYTALAINHEEKKKDYTNIKSLHIPARETPHDYKF